MSIQTVPMYRVVCDHDGCDASAQDDGEHWAWSDHGYALQEATNRDWYVVHEPGSEYVHLCTEHAPRCRADDCAISLTDNEMDGYCEDHFPEPVSS